MKILSIWMVVGLAVPLPKENGPKTAWTMDPRMMKAPGGPIAGKLLGGDFKLDKISLQSSGALLLKSGNDAVFIFLPLKFGQAIEGKSYEYGPDENDKRPRPGIHVHIHSIKPVRATAFSKGYAMRLEFGKEQGGSVPGKLYLCLPDNGKSFIAGTFTLKLQ
jgi:hypothetical protein